jgi:response regulator NasT
VTARERPDVALVGLGESSEDALELIEWIVKEAAFPVIVIINAPDPWFINEAAKRGVFAYIIDGEAGDWQGAIDIVLRRFREYQNLEGAFGRRAIAVVRNSPRRAEAKALIDLVLSPRGRSALEAAGFGVP